MSDNGNDTLYRVIGNYESRAVEVVVWRGIRTLTDQGMVPYTHLGESERFRIYLLADHLIQESQRAAASRTPLDDEWIALTAEKVPNVLPPLGPVASAINSDAARAVAEWATLRGATPRSTDSYNVALLAGYLRDTFADRTVRNFLRTAERSAAEIAAASFKAAHADSWLRTAATRLLAQHGPIANRGENGSDQSDWLLVLRMTMHVERTYPFGP